MTKPDWILQRIKLSPDKVALVDIEKNLEWTYANLADEIAKWIKFFDAKGMDKGDRICVLSENSIELFSIMFACGLLGLMYVPLNFRLSHRELIDLKEDSSCSLFIFSQTFSDVAKLIDDVERIAIEEIEPIDESLFDLSLPELKLSEPWLMIYTGGTTGKPKGVVISHDAVLTNAINTISTWSIGEKDVTVNYMPLFHTGGINALAVPILLAGGKTVIGNRFDAEEALRMTNKYKATISLFVPTMYQEMISTDYFLTEAFPSMRVFLSGGAPCPPQVYDAFREKDLHFKEGYGLTEAGPNNFFIRPEIAREKVGSVGKNMLFNEVMVVNDKGDVCAPNEVGELFLKGKHLFTRYWNNEAATTEVLFDGWLRTGDLAKYDEEGDYYIVGRKKDMIISGGENVYPQEIEQCLLLHDAVAEAAVVGIPDEKWGERIVAFVVANKGYFVDEEKLRLHCEKYLGRYKVPKQFFELESLPKTGVGKIDKKKLVEVVLTN